MRYAAMVLVLNGSILGLTACTGRMATAELPSRAQTPTITLVGTVTTRGAQIEAWYGMRAQDGKLWRLEPATANIKEQLMRRNNQSARVEGTAMESATSGDFPTLVVTQVF